MDVPNCFPPGSQKCSNSRNPDGICCRITTAPPKKNVSKRLGVGDQFSCETPMNNFLLLQHGRDAGTHFIFGKRGYVPDLISSGRTALSAELPSEPCCAITQGGHLRSVWVWSRARVMNGCFFVFVAHQHFYLAINLPGPCCNFSPCCGIAFVYFCVFSCLAVNRKAPALSHRHRRSGCGSLIYNTVG